MAKSGSKRTPNKNIADIAGRPTMSYPIEALRVSGVCQKVIVSTDSEEYGEIALACDADSYVLRDAWTDKFAEFSVTANAAAKIYQEDTDYRFTQLVVCGANVMFLRPSWIRAASTLLSEFVYNQMPIDVVGMEPYHWNVNVCRIRKGIMTHSNFFVFKHIGILMEMDWPHELKLARQISQSILDGEIDYSLDERVHDDLILNRDQAANRMRGLMLRTRLLGTETPNKSEA
ncbi:MAG: hypothetical protein OXT74_09470 [Candidatus Poribacteria bacterium]|nr:hypothetical protein [Candidatus Poribacteria bacterium]